MATEDLRFRAATVDDLDRILEIHVAAFPDERGTEERRRNFTASRFGALDDLVLALRGDEIVGQAFLFPLEAWFGGRAVQIGAVASLAVAPEARCQGVATALLGGLHVASDMRGDALTMLYAYRQRFYTRVGYGQTASRRRLAIDPAAVPDSWRALARSRVRRARGEDKEAIRVGLCALRRPIERLAHARRQGMGASPRARAPPVPRRRSPRARRRRHGGLRRVRGAAGRDARRDAHQRRRARG